MYASHIGAPLTPKSANGCMYASHIGAPLTPKVRQWLYVG